MTKIVNQALESPFTDEQVKTFNINQVLAGHKQMQGATGALICPEAASDGHEPIAGVVGLLIGTKMVIACPCCDYYTKAAPTSTLEAIPSTEGPLDDPEYPALLGFVREANTQLQELLNADRHFTALNTMQSNVGQYLKDLSSRFRPKGPSLEAVPLSLMLTLHNQSPPDSITRRVIIGYIQADNVMKPRQHWMGGLYLNAKGDLCFDEALYEKTVWRGKQETYFETVEKSYEHLQQSLKSLHRFQGLEDSITALPSDIRPLLPVRPLKAEVAQLKSIQPRIEALVEAMEGRSFANLAANIRPEPNASLTGAAEQAKLNNESQ